MKFIFTLFLIFIFNFLHIQAQICDVGFNVNKSHLSGGSHTGDSNTDKCFNTGEKIYFDVMPDSTYIHLNSSGTFHDDCKKDSVSGFFDTVIFWSAVQIDINAEKLFTGDMKFATRTRGSGWRDISDIVDCAGSKLLQAEAVIDLTSTPYAIKNDGLVTDDFECEVSMLTNTEETKSCSQWTLSGYNGAMSIKCVNNNQICTIKCGGSSARCRPTNNYIKLTKKDVQAVNICPTTKLCTKCRENSASMVVSDTCHCNTGFYGNKDETCAKCEAGKYKNINIADNVISGRSATTSENKDGNIQSTWSLTDGIKNDSFVFESKDMALIHMDLTKVFMVDFIRIYNQRTCCINEVDIFEIYLTETNTFQKNNACEFVRVISDITDIKCGVNGRHLWITTSTAKSTISLSEVEVFESLPCLNCAVHSSSLTGSGTCQCNPGFTGADPKTCTKCEAGKYKSNLGSEACVACPLNSYSVTIGGDKISSCSCNSGYYDVPSNVCKSCESGKYKTTSGSHMCTNCPADTYSYDTAQISKTTCEVCSPKSSSLPGSSHIDSCICNEGYYEHPSGLWKCNECLMGTYKDVLGDHKCTSCPINTYQSVLGATNPDSCKSCQYKSSSLIGTSSSHSCLCDPGYTGNFAKKCTICEAGSYKMTAGSAACTLCTPGKHSTVEGATIDSCTDCKAGTFTQVPGKTECSSCDAGKYNKFEGSNDIIACISCVPGKYSSSLQAVSETTCESCVEGTFSIQNAATSFLSCTKCGVGSYSTILGANTESSCQLCGMGKYSGNFGASTKETCLDCIAGKYLQVLGGTKDTDCIACNTGKFSTNIGAENNNTCLSCEEGKNSLSASDSIDDCLNVCGFGETGIAGNCKSCLAGEYKNELGTALCSFCPENSQSTIKSEFCSCNVGYYKILDGSCDVCETGKFKSNIELDDCVDCVAGKYLDVTGAISIASCIDCGTGKYSSTLGAKNVNVCLDCVKGKYSSQSGMDGEYKCSSCIPGTFSITTGATSDIKCTKCDSGKYSNHIAANSAIFCENCERGKYSDVAGMVVEDTCKHCPTGKASPHFGANSETTCEMCNPGKYADLSATIYCNLCPPNSTNLEYGKKRIVDCECVAGYSGQNGALCVKCPPNTKKEAIGPGDCNKHINISKDMLCSVCQ